MTTRRAFIGALAAGLLAVPDPARAQQAGKVPRIGILEPYALNDPISRQISEILRDVGYTEGRDIAIEWRSGAGQTARFPALAAELVNLKPEAIIAIGDLAIRAARNATAVIPIVTASDDLVGEGHVASLARPGANVTGVTILASELNAKRLEVLKAAVPTAKRVAALWDPATGDFHLSGLRAVARTLGVEVAIQRVRDGKDLPGAFEAARTWHAQAVNVLASPLVYSLRGQIIGQAARTRLPAIYQWDEAVKDGGLMSYGPTHAEVLRAMCVQLDRVLRGAQPASLPIEQPTKFKLVINLKTAKAVGLTIPQSVLGRADEVIQ